MYQRTIYRKTDGQLTENEQITITVERRTVYNVWTDNYYSERIDVLTPGRTGVFTPRQSDIFIQGMDRHEEQTKVLV